MTNVYNYTNLKLKEEEKHFGIEILQSDDTFELPDMPSYPIENTNINLPDSFDDID